MSEPRSLGKASKEFSEGRLENWYRSEVWGRGSGGGGGGEGGGGTQIDKCESEGWIDIMVLSLKLGSSTIFS